MIPSRLRSAAQFGAGIAIAAVALTSFTALATSGPSPEESTFVPVTPVRILDTRDGVDLGLAGPFVSPVGQDLQVTGEIPTATGTRTVVPQGASGVVLNVTVVNPGAAGFLAVRPAGTPGAPTTSNLNFEAGVVTPNAVNVALPTTGAGAGKIEITYDAFGQAGPSTDVLVDVVGYTTSGGLQELVAVVAELTERAAPQSFTAEVSTAGQKIGTGPFTVTRAQPGFYQVTFDVTGLGWVDKPHAQVSSQCTNRIPAVLATNSTETTRTFTVYQQDRSTGDLADCAFFLTVRDADRIDWVD